MTITDIGSDSSEGAGVNEPHTSDALPPGAPDGRAITASCGCDSVSDGPHDPLHERPQNCPWQNGALAGPPRQPQPMLPGLEGC